MALVVGKTVCEGSYREPKGSQCSVCHKEILVAQSNGGRVMAHTQEA